jgi:hypothetical protein
LLCGPKADFHLDYVVLTHVDDVFVFDEEGLKFIAKGEVPRVVTKAVIESAGRRVGVSNARISIRVEGEKIDSERKVYIVDIDITVKPVAVLDVAHDVPGGTETIEVQKLPWFTKKEKEKLGVAAFFVGIMVLIVVILPTVLIKSGAPHG